MSIKWKMDRL